MCALYCCMHFEIQARDTSCLLGGSDVTDVKDVFVVGLTSIGPPSTLQALRNVERFHYARIDDDGAAIEIDLRLSGYGFVQDQEEDDHATPSSALRPRYHFCKNTLLCSCVHDSTSRAKSLGSS